MTTNSPKIPGNSYFYSKCITLHPTQTYDINRKFEALLLDCGASINIPNLSSTIPSIIFTEGS